MTIQGQAPESTAKVTLSPAVLEVFDPIRYPRGSVSYRALFGGRGSGKSYSAALVAALMGYVERLRVLCVREYQNSIAQSFHAELKAAIEAHEWLSEHYDVQRDKIVGANGTEFIFKGLHANPTAIKSLAKIDLTIVEEAEDIPEESWLQLEATVLRQPKSEIWALWNPRKKGSPVDVRFRQHPPKDAIVRQINYDDNPFFPDGLKKLCERQREILDYATWAHVWLGAYLENSASQIFNGRFEQKEFTPGEDWDGPYQGGDWGYSQDPTAMIRAWIHDECLWIEYEAGGVGIELDDVPRVAASIPDFAKFECRWDSAQPAMISHVKAKGLRRSVPADKGKGSVEDGIQFIRSFRRVYIHPRCKETLEEFRSYSWKVDRLSGQVLDKPVDAFNHYCDALRYALEPVMKRSRSSMTLRAIIGDKR